MRVGQAVEPERDHTDRALHARARRGSAGRDGWPRPQGGGQAVREGGGR